MQSYHNWENKNNERDLSLFLQNEKSQRPVYTQSSKWYQAENSAMSVVNHVTLISALKPPRVVERFCFLGFPRVTELLAEYGLLSQVIQYG